MRHLLALLFLLPALALASPSATLTPGQYNSLNEIQELLANNDFVNADQRLTKMAESLSPSFALALTYQLHGQLYLMQENYSKGLDFFQKALGLKVLDTAQEVSIATTASQIQLSMEQPKTAYQTLVPVVEHALAEEGEVRSERPRRKHMREARKEDLDSRRAQRRLVQPQALVTLATACQLQKDYKTSIPWLELAFDRSEEPKENWLLMLMVAHYHEGDYLSAAEVIDELLRLNPNKEEYYMQQAAMYQLLEKPVLALRSLEIGYGTGNISKDSHVLQLVQLLISQNVPERAARILNKHLQDNSIELTESNWNLLAAAWMQAREREQAAKALVMASEKQKDGLLLLRAAQLRSQDANHKNALGDAQKALQKGLEDKDKAQALMLAASSAYELKDLDTSRRYFQQALAYASVASNAKNWLDYITTLEEFNL